MGNNITIDLVHLFIGKVFFPRFDRKKDYMRVVSGDYRAA